MAGCHELSTLFYPLHSQDEPPTVARPRPDGRLDTQRANYPTRCRPACLLGIFSCDLLLPDFFAFVFNALLSFLE